MRFFQDESCGQCTPCRNGTEKAVALMENGGWQRETLSDLALVMADASICGLGPGRSQSAALAAQVFPEEIRERTRHLHPRWPRGRRPTGRDNLAGRQARGCRNTPSLLASRGRLPGRRQLPGLHGRDRGRAGFWRHPVSDSRHRAWSSVQPPNAPESLKSWSSSCCSPTSRRARGLTIHSRHSGAG